MKDFVLLVSVIKYPDNSSTGHHSTELKETRTQNGYISVTGKSRK